MAAAVDYLQHNDLGNPGATVAFTATIGTTPHTFIYEQVGDTPNSANDILVDLQGVTLTNLSQLITNGQIDPIVLDLGAPGISFTSLGNGVQFDMNSNGVPSQIAWTTGEDGILAYDLNGSGKIENGSEIFSPNFAGGHFTDSLAALASLDNNHDGVISAADPAFPKLVVWQDLNHNGVSDPGELKSLTDLGITDISLNATAGSGTINGQELLTKGTFTYAGGRTGDYVAVSLSQASADSSASTTSKIDYRSVSVNLSSVPVQADLYSGVATATGVAAAAAMTALSNLPVEADIGVSTTASMTTLDTFGNTAALSAIHEVVGTHHAEALLAGGNGVTFDARDGDDAPHGSGADIMIGGASNDHFAGGGIGDAIDRGPDTDAVDLGDSRSAVSVHDSGDASGTSASFASPANGKTGGSFAEGNHLSGKEHIIGSSHDHALIGHAADNVLESEAGSDVLRGKGGDDTLIGHGAGDTLHGGEGNDTLNGGRGNDTLVESRGNDTIDGGRAAIRSATARIAIRSTIAGIAIGSTTAG